MFTIRDLLRATLRHRPDRIIVGEVRGGEAFDLLQTLNTGHSGSLSTIHANSAELALARFASGVLQAASGCLTRCRLISESIDLVLHLERRRGVRCVSEVVSVTGYDADRDVYELETGQRASESSGDEVRDLEGRRHRRYATQPQTDGRDRETLHRPTLERHYSVEQIAELCHVSHEFVRRLFLREPGVVIFFRIPSGPPVEQLIRNRQVIGSSPIAGSKSVHPRIHK